VSKKVKEFELAALRAKFGGVRDYVLITPEKVDALTDYTFRKTLRGKNIQVSLSRTRSPRRFFPKAASRRWTGSRAPR
jgi:hypothetical protein